MGYLLDTNIVSAIIKNDPRVIDRLMTLDLRSQVAISAVTYYECKRGILAKFSQRQLDGFNNFCQVVEILPITHPEIVEIASEIYADLRRRGCLIQDADILIAATAIARKFVLVSNDSDLARVVGLPLENWLVA